VLLGSVVGGIAGLLLLNLVVLPVLMFIAAGADADQLSDAELRSHIRNLAAWPWVYAASGLLLGALSGFVAARARPSEPLHVALASGILVAGVSTFAAVARSTPLGAATIAYTVLIVVGAAFAAVPRLRRAV
jgi:hypothetical protein